MNLCFSVSIEIGSSVKLIRLLVTSYNILKRQLNLPLPIYTQCWMHCYLLPTSIFFRCSINVWRVSRGREKGKRTTIVWEGSLGPDFFEEALYERFPVKSRSDFTKEAPLRGYDERKEEWPKCMHGEDYLVQIFTEEIDEGRRFFKCPRAWVIAITICFLNMFHFYTTYMIYLLQSSLGEENCGFTR